MTKEEKVLLIEVLLQDVRNNWSSLTTERVETAAKLCDELGGEFAILSLTCREFLEDSVVDGRFFREDFPYGYIGMDKMHRLDRRLEGKSEDFVALAEKLVTCPGMAFKKA